MALKDLSALALNISQYVFPSESMIHDDTKILEHSLF